MRKGFMALLVLVAMFFMTACDMDEQGADNHNRMTYEKGGVKVSYMETSFSNSKGGQVIVRYDNTNGYDVEITTDLTFYSEGGDIISILCKSNNCVEAGSSCVEVFESDVKYASYACDLTVAKAASYHSDEMKELSWDTKKDSDGNLSYSVRNDWDTRLSAELLVFYFGQDNNLVGYGRQTLTLKASSCTEGSMKQPDQNYLVDASYLILH